MENHRKGRKNVLEKIDANGVSRTPKKKPEYLPGKPRKVPIFLGNWKQLVLGVNQVDGN